MEIQQRVLRILRILGVKYLVTRDQASNLSSSSLGSDDRGWSLITSKYSMESLEKEQGEKNLPENEQSTVILAFPEQVKEESVVEQENNFEVYEALGGVLRKTEYQDVLSRAAHGEEIPASSLSLKLAHSMARVAGITLSPETTTLYVMLRNEKPDQGSEDYHRLSDQELLAEALRMSGDTSSLTTFIQKYPQIFTEA